MASKPFFLRLFTSEYPSDFEDRLDKRGSLSQIRTVGSSNPAMGSW